MVEWYNPAQLMRTAFKVAASTLIGKHSDRRLIEALSSRAEHVFDYSNRSGDFWIDYISDTGDGWDSTYAVAYFAAQPQLSLNPTVNSTSTPILTQRGDILVFGGDQVYPTPSHKNYNERLVVPYSLALPSDSNAAPDLFAIPGNHDWYDSLVSFSRLFCSATDAEPGRRIGAWRTQQKRSYFALKLPHHWWLLGTDVQLGSDIDAPQVAYFRWIASQLSQHDRIILCNAEPDWVYAKMYQEIDSEINERNLHFLEHQVLGKKVSIFLAGDQHHYRRHQAPDGSQKITAGGGGAFLHPTHGDDVSELEDAYQLKCSYPSVEQSRQLAWKNWLFPLYNWKFGLVPAVFYFLTAWSIRPQIGDLGWDQLGAVLEITVAAALESPVSAFWGLAIFFGFVLFTDTHSRLYRWTAGPIHSLAHLIALFFLGWSASYLCTTHWALGPLARIVVTACLVFAGGWFLGSVILGLYLLVSINVFGRHSRDAFSSLRIPDWKNFIRIRISPDGALTLFPVGIQRAPRHWSPPASGATSKLAPNDPRAIPPALIEPPITLSGPKPKLTD